MIKCNTLYKFKSVNSKHTYPMSLALHNSDKNRVIKAYNKDYINKYILNINVQHKMLTNLRSLLIRV